MDIFRHTSPTRENLSLLSIMDAIEDRARITQRELAHTTGLNLKKVNYCLHKLLEKGHVKFQRVRKNPDKRAYLYILTPAGLKAKSQLTYGFLRLTLEFYNKMEEKLRRCLMEMHKANVKRVVLYGGSEIACIVLGVVDGEGPEIVGLIDDMYPGNEFQDLCVFKNASLLDIEWDGVLIIAMDVLEVAETQLLAMGVPDKAIWKLS
jgi:EPS-associated MarR family transcriptional regulator